MKIYDIIQNKVAYFQKNGINDTALEYSNIINVLNEILAEISTFLTDTKFNISDFLDILSNRFEKQRLMLYLFVLMRYPYLKQEEQWHSI